jgi:hypothetical protein
VGCYTCHNGPGSESANNSTPPTVSNVSATTAAGQPVSMTLPVTGANATLRIISQAANGSIGLSNGVATYFPDPSFEGVDTFTFAAYDGAKNSTLAMGTITVGNPTNPPPVAPVITSQPASQTVNAGATVTLTVAASGTPPLSYQWRKNGASLSGATGTSLTLASVTTADAGSYTVVVSNAGGSVTSDTAILTVNTATFTVALTSPPNGAIYRAGASVRLTASVSPAGSARRVQFFDGTALLSTDTSAPFTITRSFNAGVHTLTARATNRSGATATSAPVQITLRRRTESFARRD